VRITIISIGKFSQQDANRQLFLNYQKRLNWKIELKELELKVSNLANLQGDSLKNKEADLLLSKVPNSAKIIALDENGKMFSSPEFANKIKSYGNCGHSNLAFIIGGADGIGEVIRQKADLILSFSKMTFPHMMIRSFLIEQIYRASTIINNHPYHRV
jgi:23S rRNA (pseudouridine1915-N3)-methyltransferase